jgi:hypothetical protein
MGRSRENDEAALMSEFDQETYRYAKRSGTSEEAARALNHFDSALYRLADNGRPGLMWGIIFPLGATANVLFGGNSSEHNLLTISLAVFLFVFGLVWYAAHRAAFKAVSRQRQDFLSRAPDAVKQSALPGTWRTF